VIPRKHHYLIVEDFSLTDPIREVEIELAEKGRNILTSTNRMHQFRGEVAMADGSDQDTKGIA
jgi:hypothetical protein